MQSEKFCKRVLVTGASGFAGGFVSRYLQNEGFQVTGTVYKHPVKGNIRVVACNLAEPWEFEGNYDAIVHVAGSLPYQQPSMLDYKRNNVDAMQNLLEFARRSGVERIINFSTIGIYGDFQGNAAVDEETPRIDPDGYGLSKYMAECMLCESGLENISLRMPGIVGLGARHVWFTNTVKNFMHGEPVKIYSPDFKTRNFVWLPDLAVFVARLLRTMEWPTNKLVLACRESISIREMVEEMKLLTDSTSVITVGESQRLPFCLNPAKALSMGYDPIAPKKIVREYIRGMHKNAY